MNVYYHLSDYISHRRAGKAYMACLQGMEGVSLVDDPALADLVVLHEEPFRYAATIAAMPPRPGRKHIGYAVWETPELPAPFVDGVRAVDAVWTCSEFSRRAFTPYVKTSVLPHVVERLRPSRDDVTWAMERLGIREMRRDDRRTTYLYTIVDTVNPRKDIQTLLAAFSLAFGDKTNVRLVVKQYREPQPLEGIPGVIDIPETLSDGQIAALHAVCDVYASAHHAEAWGLPLSEAIAMGNPVVATGYSGNMEFMTLENSYPVPYTIVPVSERMCKALPDIFSPGMTWADIDVPSLVATLRTVCSRPVTQEFRLRAASSMEAFSPAAVRQRLRQLLAAV